MRALRQPVSPGLQVHLSNDITACKYAERQVSLVQAGEKEGEEVEVWEAAARLGNYLEAVALPMQHGSQLEVHDLPQRRNCLVSSTAGHDAVHQALCHTNVKSCRCMVRGAGSGDLWGQPDESAQCACSSFRRRQQSRQAAEQPGRRQCGRQGFRAQRGQPGQVAHAEAHPHGLPERYKQCWQQRQAQHPCCCSC